MRAYMCACITYIKYAAVTFLPEAEIGCTERRPLVTRKGSEGVERLALYSKPIWEVLGFVFFSLGNYIYSSEHMFCQSCTVRWFLSLFHFIR